MSLSLSHASVSAGLLLCHGWQKWKGSSAIRALGLCYQLGRGVSKDDKQGFQLFRKAAELDDAPAMYNLGVSLSRGDGCDADADGALACYRAAAARGFDEAWVAVADKLPTSESRERLAALQQAADKGSVAAHLCLGSAHMLGIEVPKNEKAALNHLQAAARNLASSQEVLATCRALLPMVATGAEYGILGSGKFAEAWLVEMEENVAVSKLYHRNKPKTLQAGFYELIALLAVQTHPNVVKLMGIVDAHNFYQGDLEFILEFAELGSLEQVVEFSDQKGNQHPIANPTLREQLLESPAGLRYLALDVAAGLAHMLSRGLIHRDLSLRNVFLSKDWRAVIGDLGLTRFVDEKGEYPLDGHSSKSARYLPNFEVY